MERESPVQGGLLPSGRCVRSSPPQWVLLQGKQVTCTRSGSHQPLHLSCRLPRPLLCTSAAGTSPAGTAAAATAAAETLLWVLVPPQTLRRGTAGLQAAVFRRKPSLLWRGAAGAAGAERRYPPMARTCACILLARRTLTQGERRSDCSTMGRHIRHHVVSCGLLAVLLGLSAEARGSSGHPGAKSLGACRLPLGPLLAGCRLATSCSVNGLASLAWHCCSVSVASNCCCVSLCVLQATTAGAHKQLAAAGC